MRSSARTLAMWLLAAMCTLAALFASAHVARAAVALADSVHAAPADSAALAPPAPAIATPPAAEPDPLAAARAGFTPENRSYSRIRVTLRLLGPWFGILAGLLLLSSRASALFRDIAHALGQRLYVRVLVYFTLYSLAMYLLGLPLAWYEEFAVEHQYGLSTQSLLAWFGDSLKALAFSVVVIGVVPLLALAWSTIARFPRRWWLFVAAGTVPVALAAILLEPLVFDPMFHHFKPLPDSPLRTDILALAARAGIPSRHVYEVDMSAQTKKLNAYVNGFGASQRIVLWDTTLQRMKRDEILFVMGHEMGHYVLGHVWRGMLLLCVGAFAVFFVVARLTEWFVHQFGKWWRIESVSDLAAMPVLMIALSLVTLTTQPIVNAVSRDIEHEADVFALELTHDNSAGARAFLALAEGNRSDPEPPKWIELLLYDHPPLGARIQFAESYKPWESGVAPKAFKGR